MVSPLVEQLSAFRSKEVKEFQLTLEKGKDILNISKIKLEVPRTATR